MLLWSCDWLRLTGASEVSAAVKVHMHKVKVLNLSSGVLRGVSLPILLHWIKSASFLTVLSMKVTERTFLKESHNPLKISLFFICILYVLSYLHYYQSHHLYITANGFANHAWVFSYLDVFILLFATSTAFILNWIKNALLYQRNCPSQAHLYILVLLLLMRANSNKRKTSLLKFSYINVTFIIKNTYRQVGFQFPAMQSTLCGRIYTVCLCFNTAVVQ